MNTVHFYTMQKKKKERKPLEPINKFSKVAGTKSIYKNLLCFYALEMNYQKENIRKQSYLQ